ncbi:dienelactone hydrolase [Fulvivirga ulvae]|uniref:alpha/beta hydrolase family protein n=1 Tax=Fulvivirga ulvae TaxID=2904245 RepID=UPI001F363BE3|nr:dienelactone hydrolase [Fulvivirga ulvae]UII33907.1 dienelactone hydrolase [Fulvivirga ulvae]
MHKVLPIIVFVFFTCNAGAQSYIGQQTLELYDQSRSRPVITEIWYPSYKAPIEADVKFKTPFVRETTTRNAPLPEKKLSLIMLSHGTGGGRLTLEWLAAGLVKQGYMVAAVDHWGNTFDNKIPEQFLKFWERPKDISFAITALLSDDKIGQAIDKERIVVAGFSLGGFTAIALSGGMLDYEQLMAFTDSEKGEKEADIPELHDLPDLLKNEAFMEKLLEEYKNSGSLADHRIKATLAIAPALGQGFKNEEQVRSINIPVFIIGAEGDEMAPVETNAAHYHQLIEGSGFFLFEGEVGHYVFLNEINVPMEGDAAIFFGDHATVDRNQVHQKTIGLSTAFFEKSLKD